MGNKANIPLAIYQQKQEFNPYPINLNPEYIELGKKVFEQNNLKLLEVK